MYKISVIVPVYNAEDTLENAISSVINQTIGFHNIELILVDDASSDNSKLIIQKYADKYDNIKPIFLSENSGSPSKTRNIGIDNSTAPYLMFLDNDDEFYVDYCEVLYNSIVNNDVDIVSCTNSSKLNNQVYISKNIDEINFHEKSYDYEDKLFLKLVVWGNIFKSSLIKENNIQFPLSLYEDGVFYLQCLLKTDKPVINLPYYPGYVYLITNEDSITHKADLSTLTRFLDGFNLCGKLLKENNRQDVEQRLFASFINMVIFILFKLDDLDNGIKLVYEFEKSLDFKITLRSKPLNIVNNKIMNKHFLQAKILIKLMGLLYNNNKIRNFVFVNYSNLKILE